jgi:hypothetical protein
MYIYIWIHLAQVEFSKGPFHKSQGISWLYQEILEEEEEEEERCSMGTIIYNIQ